MENTIDVKNVTMRFIMEQERTDTLKEYMVKLVRRKLKYTGFTALKDVSFSVRPGDSLALIGQNGSGKSTMLKLIAGVMEPTKGSVTVRGSIAPLIELSAGFDPDLTGRENIFLNGALLGYRRKFMQAIYDEIVDFADLGEFIDVPVRSYSSGMIPGWASPSPPTCSRTSWWWTRCWPLATTTSSRSATAAWSRCWARARRCCSSPTTPIR